MRRLLTAGIGLGLGLGLTAASPAAAVNLVCFSADVACQSYSCPPDAVEVVNEGFNDTGPWLVVCRPTV
jgi:hypothetical protein